MEEVFDKIVEKGFQLGAEYIDMRYQEVKSEIIVSENGKFSRYESEAARGVGITAIVDGIPGFASTTIINPDILLEVLNEAVKIAKTSTKLVNKKVYAEIEPYTDEKTVSVKVDPFEVSPDEKVNFVVNVNKASIISDEVKSVSTALGVEEDQRWFLSSEGANIKTRILLTGLRHYSVAKVNGVMERVRDAETFVGGYEFFKEFNAEKFVTDLSRLAIDAAKAKPAKPGTYPVVADPDIIGLILHEAFGHASEGDLVASKESVLCGKLGEKVASEYVTIVDNGVVKGGYPVWYDDQGVKKMKTVIVKEGILDGYLLSRETASDLGLEPTGNARAQDFENVPIVRQTNYYMEPGDHSFEELVEDVDFGYYIKGRGGGGGQVDVGVGSFIFNAGPSYVIEKGEIKELVKSVSISGLILETLKSVDAVGKDFKVTTSVFGGCGKSAQRVRVGHGGPFVRIRKMIIGGR